jgi:hypothetical protein
MEEIESHLLLEELEHLLLRLTEIVEREFGPLSNTQLNWKANPKSWSIAECLHHLNIISGYYIPLFMQRIELGVKRSLKPKSHFKYRYLGNYMVNSVQLQEDNRVKNKIKSPKAYNPQKSEFSTVEVLQSYLKDQEEMIAVLSAAKAVDLSKVRVPIAIFPLIKLRLGDMLRFVIYHNERHIVQAQKVRTENQFPRN